MDRVLLVEDEDGLAKTIVDGLTQQGFSVESTGDGFAGYRKAKVEPFDVIILDWMLPTMSGIEVCRRLRQESILTPVLFLTAKDGTSDETGALEAGADDYLRKPFEFAVLVARCEALVRRQQRGAWSELSLGELSLDTRRRIARVGESRIALSRRETEVLDYLMRAGGSVRSREDLLRDVWGSSSETGPNLVEVYIGYLRRKLEPAMGYRALETVRGAGYRLRADG